MAHHLVLPCRQNRGTIRGTERGLCSMRFQPVQRADRAVQIHSGSALPPHSLLAASGEGGGEVGVAHTGPWKRQDIARQPGFGAKRRCHKIVEGMPSSDCAHMPVVASRHAEACGLTRHHASYCPCRRVAVDRAPLLLGASASIAWPPAQLLRAHDPAGRGPPSLLCVLWSRR